MNKTKAAALTTVLLLTSTVHSQGAIVLTGDFVNGTVEIGGTTVPTLTITEDIVFGILADGTVQAIVFDEWLANPNAFVVTVPAVGGSQPLNVVNDTTVANPLLFHLGDGGEAFGEVTVNDGFLIIGDIDVTSGTSFTIRAGSFTFVPNSGFNPELNGRTFTGNAFLGGGQGLVALSALTPVSASTLVPEPSAALLSLLSSIGLLCRRVRH